MSRSRRVFSKEFKAKVVLEALKEKNNLSVAFFLFLSKKLLLVVFFLVFAIQFRLVRIQINFSALYESFRQFVGSHV